MTRTDNPRATRYLAERTATLRGGLSIASFGKIDLRPAKGVGITVVDRPSTTQ
jgi:hypothetical protein